jgi:CheY-like chemotaxis protein
MGKILLIDDEPGFTRLLSNYIKDNFPLLQVEVCNNPVSALAFLKKNHYDLLLIDFEMPMLDGRKLMNFAVQMGIDKNRIVLLSSKDADFLHEQCPMGTCLAVLNKHEVRQKAVLNMIFSSLNQKAAAPPDPNNA